MRRILRLAFRRWRRPRNNRDVGGARVYLAARFARQAELRSIAQELAEAGAEVRCRWLWGERSLAHDELAAHGRGADLAQMDFEDLKGASLCIAFTEHGAGPGGRGGRHAELGIALALGMRVVVVGPREHVFHCLPSIEHYETWDAARAVLAGAAAPELSAVAPVEAGGSEELVAL